MKVGIEVSARHLHLSVNDCLALFGKTELTKRNNLSQPGEFAAEEIVEVAGHKKSFHKVRVLGPLRSKTQVELSRSDALQIGVDAPLALSGSGEGGEVKLIGPIGSVQIRAAIVAKRHMHLHTDDAKKLKLKDQDEVKVKVYGERSVVFENVVVRVSDNFKKFVHLDTDEGNAAGLDKLGYGDLIVK